MTTFFITSGMVKNYSFARLEFALNLLVIIIKCELEFFFLCTNVIVKIIMTTWLYMYHWFQTCTEQLMFIYVGIRQKNI